MNPAFWVGRAVLVTGHTGFKGSWLSLWLQRLGARAVGYALEPPTDPSLFAAARVGSGMTSVLGDVRDADALAAVVDAHRPEVVIHMAAQSVVRASFDHPVETYATNVMGTIHLFEAVRRAGLRCAIVNVTSDKCYENHEWPWAYRESDPVGGHDPYSSSKGCAELVTAAYRRSFFPPAAHHDHGVAVASVRAGNAIGGGDWTRDQLIPDLMGAFAAARPARLRNPVAIRPWQFVLEPLRGYLTVAERLVTEGASFGSAWNFGPAEEDARPVAWVAERLAALWGEPAAVSTEPNPGPHEAQQLRLDTGKARALLGWSPRVPLERALEWITAWYRGNARGDDPRALTLAQIVQYERVIG
jgi:CDP-glucose 4,6-dehydratase